MMKVILATILPVLIAYVAWSFIKVDFDFSNWTEKERTGLVFIAPFCAAVGLSIYKAATAKNSL